MKITWTGEKIEMTSSYGVPRMAGTCDGIMYAISTTPMEDGDGDPVELYAEVSVDEYGDDYEKHQEEMERELESMILEQAAALGIPAEAIAFDW